MKYIENMVGQWDNGRSLNFPGKLGMYRDGASLPELSRKKIGMRYYRECRGPCEVAGVRGKAVWGGSEFRGIVRVRWSFRVLIEILINIHNVSEYWKV